MMHLTARGVAIELGGRSVVAGASLVCAAGEIIGLIGPNAAGKTTLLRALAGLLVCAAGEVLLSDRPLAAYTHSERARRIAYLAQGVRAEWPLRVDRLVGLGRIPHLGPWRSPGQRDAAAVARALALCEIAHLATRSVDRLSGGETARVMLARALAGEPAIVLADEPISHLDPYHQLKVMETLRDVARAGAGVMVVLHDLALAARFCDRLVLMDGGRIVADGRPEHVLAPEMVARVYGVETARIEREDGFSVIPWRRIDAPRAARPGT